MEKTTIAAEKPFDPKLGAMPILRVEPFQCGRCTKTWRRIPAKAARGFCQVFEWTCDCGAVLQKEAM